MQSTRIILPIYCVSVYVNTLLKFEGSITDFYTLEKILKHQ